MHNTYAIDGTIKGMTVSPGRTEIDIMPGTTKQKTVTVENNTEKNMTVELSAEAFSVINQQYDYKFTSESKTASWIRFDKNIIELTPSQKIDIPYSINVPNNAEPGGQYLSIFATTDTPASSKAILSKQRIASLLYITVLGDVTRTGKLIFLNSPWLINGNNMWSMSVQNTGSAHFRSNYQLKIFDLFGKNIKSSEKNSSLILPETIRNVTGLVPIPDLPGIYKINYSITLGDSSSKNITKYFLYMPFWFIVAIISLIFAIIILVTIIKKPKKTN